MNPLLVPLFVSAFRRADDLALAMEARCYNGGEGRTKMKPLRYAGVDHKAYVLVIGYFVVKSLSRLLFPFPQKGMQRRGKFFEFRQSEDHDGMPAG